MKQLIHFADNNSKPILIVLFAIAVILRMPALFQELPPYLFCDEQIFADETMRMFASGSIVANEFKAGGLNIYPVLFIIKLFYTFTGNVPEYQQVIVFGRLIYAVILNSASIFFIFSTARLLFGRNDVAFYAAFGFLFSPMIYATSRIWYPDHYIIFFSSGFLYFVARTLKDRFDRTSHILVGLFLGLAISVKYTGLLLLLPIILVFCLNYYSVKSSKKELKTTAFKLAGYLSLTLCSALIVILIVNFSAFINYQRFIGDFIFNIHNYRQDDQIHFAGMKFYIFVLYVLTLGISGSIIYMAGYFFIFRESISTFLLLFLFPIFIALYLGSASIALHRNMAIAVPFLLPVFGYGFYRIVNMISTPFLIKRSVAYLLICLIVVSQGFQTTYAFSHDFNKDSRLLAYEWIRQNIPVKSNVGINEQCFGSSPADQNENNLVTDRFMEKKLDYYVFNSYGNSSLEFYYHNRGIGQVIDQKYIHFNYFNNLNISYFNDPRTVNDLVPQGYHILKIFSSNGPDIVVLGKSGDKVLKK